MSKMDPEIKRKWVEALRSGEYRQGAGLLRKSDDCFCCLGVLCDLLGIPWRLSEDGGAYISGSDGLGFPDDDVLDAHGLSNISGRLWALASLNDSGKPFPEIADYIEENL